MEAQLSAASASLTKAFDKLLNTLPNKEGDRTAQDFLQLTYLNRDGEDEPLFTSKSYSELWELYFIIREIGLERTYQWLYEELIPQIEDEVQKNDVQIYSLLIFNSPLLDEQREREELALSMQQDRGILSDIKSCRKCGNEKTYLRVVQDRSADEGPSSVYECPKCYACWKEN